ncbi:MAG: methionine--tRNA ligase [Gammaproteobacteria bacterium]|nr:methionine--tRNA ligase [Gammaproteobacteria bacterium]
MNSLSEKTSEKLLVTNALLYANGHMHLGHLLGYIQADIWVRVQKSLGKTCYYICGDDAHGTPIMTNAKKNNLTPEEFIKQFYTSHLQDFSDFSINFDYYGTTHSSENQELTEQIYNTLKNNGHIITKTIAQAFDPVENMFLPDRFIKGDCPKCSAADQYGDNCEYCGATYNPTDLNNPKSVLSGATPITKQSEHYFFNLPDFTQMLEEWITQGHLQSEISSKLKEWFNAGLQPWDISRDGPYFGFKIPNTDNKFFYVWLDAPIGYIACFKQFCEQQNLDFVSYWTEPNQNHKQEYSKIIHFIGKDITYFHALFWPAVLTGAGYKKPDQIYVNGFLTVNGKKMSKSRGTFIQARTYLNHLNSEYLRYYFASKLSKQVEDLDLNLTDFVQKVNSDLIGKLVNIASRCSGFINKQFGNTLSSNLKIPNATTDLYQEFVNKTDMIINYYLNIEFSAAIKEIMGLADKANQFIDLYKPWALMKQEDPTSRELTHIVCSMGINLYRVLISFLSPVLPKLSEKSALFLNSTTSNNWRDLANPLVNHKINTFEPLLSRIDSVKIEAILNDSKNFT